MLDSLKKLLYFPIASYFRFFASLRLKKWNPVVIVVTGSNGKTTLLHLLESQLGKRAKYSHHANSSYGVPFDILDLHRETLRSTEWFSLFFHAPQQVFKPLPAEKLYVVEADCDRPYEGKFLASLLRPHIVLWVSSARTHSMNFDYLVDMNMFDTVDEAIAYEYGYFAKYCRGLLLIDGESKLQTKQLERTKAEVKAINKSEYLKEYKVGKEGTTFEIQNSNISLYYLLPKELYISLAMCKETVEYLQLPFDKNFERFILPPGRGTVFEGRDDITIIDSCYNANLSSIKALLEMFAKYPSEKKWAVIGDMKELGNEEKEEHEALAKLLNSMDLERVIVIGKIISKYTLPQLHEKVKPIGFDKAPEAASFLHEHLKGGEAILFKGSQSIYLEGLIEPLLKHKEDAIKLPRQDEFWKGQRRKLGFD